MMNRAGKALAPAEKTGVKNGRDCIGEPGSAAAGQAGALDESAGSSRLAETVQTEILKKGKGQTV